MDWTKVALIVLTVGGLWQGAHRWRLRPVHPPDGILAPDAPGQLDVQGTASVTYGRWTLTPRASYDITARILSREDYSFDALSDLVPEDLALGWGALSDNRILSSLKITQGARFYEWRPVRPLPIPVQEVIEHSANTHLIPANPAIGSELAALRVGQVVHLSGLLVDGVRADGRSFRTSLTRSDTGAGACEILLVQSVALKTF